jgi:hypothetical protein
MRITKALLWNAKRNLMLRLKEIAQMDDTDLMREWKKVFYFKLDKIPAFAHGMRQELLTTALHNEIPDFWTE